MLSESKEDLGRQASIQKFNFGMIVNLKGEYIYNCQKKMWKMLFSILRGKKKEKRIFFMQTWDSIREKAVVLKNQKLFFYILTEARISSLSIG